MRTNLLPALILYVSMSARSEIVFKLVECNQGDAVPEGLSVVAYNERADHRSWEA